MPQDGMLTLNSSEECRSFHPTRNFWCRGRALRLYHSECNVEK